MDTAAQAEPRRRRRRAWFVDAAGGLRQRRRSIPATRVGARFISSSPAPCRWTAPSPPTAFILKIMAAGPAAASGWKPGTLPAPGRFRPTALKAAMTTAAVAGALPLIAPNRHLYWRHHGVGRVTRRPTCTHGWCRNDLLAGCGGHAGLRDVGQRWPGGRIHAGGLDGDNLVVTVTNGTQVVIDGGETWAVNQLVVATNATSGARLQTTLRK